MISMKLQGMAKVFSEIQKRRNKMEAQLSTAVKLSAQDVRNECVKSIQGGSRTGKVYVKRGVQHQASAPGEAPKTDTGRLVSSLGFRMTGKLTALAGSDGIVAEYAKSLEFGTRNMAARPFLVPAVEKLRSKMNERFRKIVEAAGS